ncbi:AraC family transcriptional regulator [Nocardiopsis gilva YIM 90087]|uniref:AraC family transcriptional regulator n=1 Tax=Nocardiopsis gilva YIM 90087 TaxID=1235441 RepID=A0A223S193_9ACTN|nr:helix-turn-helix domain-containing protein [Nocardiopsis gilva]ASU81886.1 AraC family transcriptional regulator [Nocardiopsis gilva YIM 90087]
MYRERRSRVPRTVLWRGRADGADEAEQRVLPDGCIDLIRVDGTLLVAGPDTAAHSAVWRPDHDIIGLRFAPGTGPTIVGVAAHELRDQRIPLTDLWGSARARRLTDLIAASSNPAATLEDIALQRLDDAVPPDPELSAITDLARAGATVTETARTLGLGERRLHRRCRSAFGYGPKTLSRILRMHRALAMARTGVPWATTAVTVGYADQAHLTREVTALAGVAPTVLVPHPPGADSGANRSTLLPSGSPSTA